MPDTGDRREIARFVNAKEAETVEESKKLVAKTKQRSAKSTQQNRSRKQRTVPDSTGGKPQESETDRDASARMVDEGDPNSKPSRP